MKTLSLFVFLQSAGDTIGHSQSIIETMRVGSMPSSTSFKAEGPSRDVVERIEDDLATARRCGGHAEPLEVLKTAAECTQVFGVGAMEARERLLDLGITEHAEPL